MSEQPSFVISIDQDLKITVAARSLDRESVERMRRLLETLRAEIALDEGSADQGAREVPHE